jgi:hypothetical protein
MRTIIITVAVAIDAMTRWLASAASALPGSALNTLMLQRIWRLSSTFCAFIGCFTFSEP